MHCVIAILYGFTIWLSCLAYAVIVGGRWGAVFCMAPLIVSGASAVLLTVDLATCGLVRAWRAYRKVKAPSQRRA